MNGDRYQFKLLIVGDSGVGKSSLLIRFCDNRFNQSQPSTVGVDFMLKNIKCRSKDVQLRIWDTAGQERFRTLTSSYYRGAHGAILMYDATNRASFDNLEFWLGEMKQHVNVPGFVCMLVGSKLDAPRERIKVSRLEGEVFAIEHSLLFYEISSKAGIGVTECFTELVEMILDDPYLALRGQSMLSLSNRTLAPSTFSSCSSC